MPFCCRGSLAADKMCREACWLQLGVATWTDYCNLNIDLDSYKTSFWNLNKNKHNSSLLWLFQKGEEAQKKVNMLKCSHELYNSGAIKSVFVVSMRALVLHNISIWKVQHDQSKWCSCTRMIRFKMCGPIAERIMQQEAGELTTSSELGLFSFSPSPKALATQRGHNKVPLSFSFLLWLHPLISSKTQKTPLMDKALEDNRFMWSY